MVSNTIAFAEGTLASRYCGIPHVWYVHEMLMDDPVLRSFMPLESLYRIMDGLSSHFVAVSQAVKKQFDPYVNKEKLHVVHTGLPDIKPASLDQPKKTMFDLLQHIPVVTFVGILSSGRAFWILWRVRGWCFSGFPRPYSYWRALTGERTRGDRSNRQVRYPRFVPHPGQSQRRPADPRGFGHAGAAFIGRSSAAGGAGGHGRRHSGSCHPQRRVRGNGRHGVTGRLVSVKNPTMLSQAIIELIDSPSKRVLMGLNGSRRYADHFNYTHYISHFEEVLDGACNGALRPIDNEKSRTSVDNLVAQFRDSQSPKPELWPPRPAD